MLYFSIRLEKIPKQHLKKFAQQQTKRVKDEVTIFWLGDYDPNHLGDCMIFSAQTTWKEQKGKG